MTASSAKNTNGHDRSAFAVVFVLPLANGLMHLPPAIGAVWTALGHRNVFDFPGLALLFAVHVLIDVADKYVDLPPETKSLWSKSTTLFASIFILLIGCMTYLCGVAMLGKLLFVPMLVIVHATPLIPYWSFKTSKLQFTNLKNVLGVFKSLFGAFCIAIMDTKPIVHHVCALNATSCISDLSKKRQAQALAYTVLYDFVLETIFDLRDVDEDKRHGVRTLPVALGRKRTLLLLAAVVIPGDLVINDNSSDFWVAAECMLRSTVTLALLAYVAKNKPRGDTAVWGFLTLMGLLPSLWAQVGLL